MDSAHVARVSAHGPPLGVDLMELIDIRAWHPIGLACLAIALYHLAGIVREVWRGR